MLLAEKMKYMRDNLRDLYYDYGDMCVNYYLEHESLLNTLGKEADKCYLELKKTDMFFRIGLLNSNILISISIDDKSFLYLYYGIKKLVINFQGLNISLGNKSISDEFVGEDIVNYKIVSLDASTKIFKYIDENFSDFMDIDIKIIELDIGTNKIIFMTKKRIYYHFGYIPLDNFNVLTNCDYKQLVDNNFQSICFCSYIKKIKSINELDINEILEYLFDKEKIFVTNANIYIILNIDNLHENKDEYKEKLCLLINKNIKFINMHFTMNFDCIECKCQFKINMGD